MAEILATDAARIELATLEDLPQLVELLQDLFELEEEFTPDPAAQEAGLRLVLEDPQRGRIFVLRNGHHVLGMVNAQFVVSTAIGTMAILMEDVIVRPEHRGRGYGTVLVNYLKDFARQRRFGRITLLTDTLSEDGIGFFEHCGFVRSPMVPMRLLIDLD